jgi:acetolactate synthase I/II/III large subunit
MAMLTGGELLVRTLIQAKVARIFGLHGAHLETIFQSCLDHGIPITDTRHEVAAGHAAEGYARVTRGLGVAMVTAGPGFTNVITSMASAYLDRTPVLYLSGAAALRDTETNTLQAGIDQVAIARPITKWAERISVAREIPRLVAHAIRLATSAPTGPVLLDLPSDVLTATVDEASVTVPVTIILDSPAAPGGGAVAAALDLLAGAARPVIMVGTGAYRSRAEEELLTFVEATGIPVYSDFEAHGLLPSNHPLYGGTLHKMADLPTGDDGIDVVLALGVRFGLFTLGGSGRLVPASAKLIHVESDAREIGRLRDTAIPIVADPCATLKALTLHARERRWPDRRRWQSVVAEAKSARRKRLSPALERKEGPIHPLQAVNAIVEHLPNDTTIVGDGAESYHWLNEVIHQNRPGSYLTHGFLGAVGFGLGLAIGAQTADPARRVLCLVGDGAVGFTIAEFHTMMRHRLPIVVVVMNNSSWAASQHFQEIVSGASRTIGTKLGETHYEQVAAAFGCFARRVTRLAELGPAIREAFASGSTACIDVTIDVAPIPPEIELLMSRF